MESNVSLDFETQRLQNYNEIIKDQEKLFMHLSSFCPHNSNSNFLHISNAQWDSLYDKMVFYYSCNQKEISFVDNARPFNCNYDDICRNRPAKYTGFLVQGRKEGFGMLTYWNGVVKYKG